MFQKFFGGLFFQTKMKNFQNYKVVKGDSTQPKLVYFISQMKSLRTWTTKGIRSSPFRHV